MPSKIDNDIWRSAILLVQSHRKEAAVFARSQAQECKDHGDLENWAIWTQTALATEELLRAEHDE